VRNPEYADRFDRMARNTPVILSNHAASAAPPRQEMGIVRTPMRCYFHSSRREGSLSVRL
jgi:hypothetical protein